MDEARESLARNDFVVVRDLVHPLEVEILQGEMQQVKEVFRTQISSLMAELHEAKGGAAAS